MHRFFCLQIGHFINLKFLFVHWKWNMMNERYRVEIRLKQKILAIDIANNKNVFGFCPKCWSRLLLFPPFKICHSKCVLCGQKINNLVSLICCSGQKTLSVSNFILMLLWMINYLMKNNYFSKEIWIIFLFFWYVFFLL